MSDLDYVLLLNLPPCDDLGIQHDFLSWRQYLWRTDMRLYRTRKARGIVDGLLLDLFNKVRNKAPQPPELVRRRPFYPTRRAPTSRILRDSVVLPTLTCSQRKAGDMTHT
jgi:hypothetical protein